MDNIEQLIKMALEEDVGTGDITSLAVIPAEQMARAHIIAKQTLTLAGIEIARRVFATLDGSVVWKAARTDGDRCPEGEVLAELTGPAQALLSGERTALNFLQHLSGIATMASRFADAVTGLPTKILDTRKTLPGYRVLEKDAVRAGCCVNHRAGLYDHFLIKGNHITAAGSIRTALKRARAAQKKGQRIEVEARTIEEVRDAAACGSDIIMLDNMSVAMVREAVGIVSGRAKLEVSGNVSLENVRAYAEAGVDFISVGRLTHSAPAADIHMLIEMME
jgi:nicotinate-nucleotide pyrophosphorylase (carboxylating)